MRNILALFILGTLCLAARAEAQCVPGDQNEWYPYRNADAGPMGTPTQYPWIGPSTASPGAPYPNGIETFDPLVYPDGTLIECSNLKAQRGHMDVTSGCFYAKTTNVSDGRGLMRPATHNGAFRSLAYAYAAPDDVNKVKWTNVTTSYRFKHVGVGTLPGADPGFKLFLRYQSEDNLYVLSWRNSGDLVIQKKVCGVYTSLGRVVGFGAPSAGVWHTIKGSVSGSTISLYINGVLQLQVNDTDLAYGVVGIRIDSFDNALIDNWRVD
jgi:hypothetical protein